MVQPHKYRQAFNVVMAYMQNHPLTQSNFRSFRRQRKYLNINLKRLKIPEPIVRLW